MDCNSIATINAIDKASLATLAAEINQEHDAAVSAARTAIEHARRCGQKLTKAKAAVGHGGYLAWLKANCRVGERQARNYMAIADGWEKISNRHPNADLTIKEALRLARPEPETVADLEPYWNPERIREVNEAMPFPLPELSPDHMLVAFGEGSAAIIAPLSEHFYTMSVFDGLDKSEGDTEAVECLRGFADFAFPLMVNAAGFVATSPWHREPVTPEMKWLTADTPEDFQVRVTTAGICFRNRQLEAVR